VSDDKTLQDRVAALEGALEPFAAAYNLFFNQQDRGDQQLYWFENTSRTGRQHPKYTLFVEDFRRAQDVLTITRRKTDE
jgi:hypothetical protein